MHLRVLLPCLALMLAGCAGTPADGAPATGTLAAGIGRLPTGALLDAAGTTTPTGAMPLGATLAPGGRFVIFSLSGWRQQGLQIVERTTGRVVQMVSQPSAFLGLAVSADGRWIYASGGNEDVVYRYAWQGDTLARRDSIVLGARSKSGGTRYPAGLALSPNGRTLYIAENLGDALAVVDVATGQVRARYPTARYPYGVVVARNGDVFVSAWTGSAVLVFQPAPDGLRQATAIPVGRHPSAMLLNHDDTRLFVASASADQISVIDTRARRVVSTLHDPPPGSVEGSTPNALALSADGRRLFVAEADNNAVAVIALGDASSGIAGRGMARDSLLGRIPVEWYPTALIASGDSLLVANGKGHGTRANLDGPTPSHGAAHDSRSYTLGQLDGSLTTLGTSELLDDSMLAALSRRVARANGWDRPAEAAAHYPPIEHVVYVIKENRTYDQVLGDLPQADGDTSLVYFPRAVSPNHHALAERFGIFDRFFVNAEVSADGHNWSTAAYNTDYTEKTVASNYSGRGRTYDYEGTNRGDDAADIPDDDVAEPANGYLWDAVTRAGVSLRNYGEYVVDADAGKSADAAGAATSSHTGRYIGVKPALRAATRANYPGFDLDIRDQLRADLWLRDFARDVETGGMPALEIVRLPNDHTAGARAGSPTPTAYMADNDLALGRIVDAISHSAYWKSTALFVLEDDAQNGPDHVDSHRSVLLVISPYARGGTMHRWVNTTDVVATMLEILHAPHLSQFDGHARPLREIWSAEPDLTPFSRLVSAADSTAVNKQGTRGARESARLDLSQEDRADENAFNRVLWNNLKGDAPFPRPHRASTAELRRSY